MIEAPSLQDLIAAMTLEEKASLCSGKDFWHLKGIERLGIPEITVTDGPHGLRKQAGDGGQVGLNESVPATCFPTASALAATWNRDLIYQVGAALGRECLAEKVGVLLGPGVNIKRSPLCGRNFEYFSEDPYLTGEMAKSQVAGIQSRGVGASVKHFAANNQETRRMSIDAVVDERALREIYLAGFEIAVVEAQPWTVMCAYNRLNGRYCAENRRLLTGILKQEWGHKGLVVTDWGAMDRRVEGLAAGTELEMPGGNRGNDERIVAAVRCGELNEGVLDRAVERVLALILNASEALAQEHHYDRQAHHALARRAACEGAVLLKNDDALLPLRQTAQVALIGRMAVAPRYQGAGSSRVHPTQLDVLYDEIVALVGDECLSYAPGYPADEADRVDDELIQAAVAIAREAEVVVICAGLTELYEVEGLDRRHMRLPASHDALIEAVAEVNRNLVVVLSNGAPVEMPWVGRVKAILEGYLGGQAGAGALADLLYGKVNPSGKLAETFPVRLEDNPSYPYFPGGPQTVEYRESLYVGYRYYDTVGQEVLFCFGHGLSYTTFEYRDLALDRERLTEDDTLTVTVTVANSGALPGQEVVQLYVRDVASTAFRPAQELKGFAKLALEPGAETQIAFELGPRAFAYYDPGLGDWHVEAGEFEILVGASSRDIRLAATVHVTSTRTPAPAVDRERLAAYHDLRAGTPIGRADFEALLGRALPGNAHGPDERFTINTPLCDMRRSRVARLLYATMQRQAKRMARDVDAPTALVMEATLREGPLRLMLMSAGGAVTREMLEALLLAINGRFFKGLFALIRAIRRNRHP